MSGKVKKRAPSKPLEEQFFEWANGWHSSCASLDAKVWLVDDHAEWAGFQPAEFRLAVYQAGVAAIALAHEAYIDQRSRQELHDSRLHALRLLGEIDAFLEQTEADLLFDLGVSPSGMLRAPQNPNLTGERKPNAERDALLMSAINFKKSLEQFAADRSQVLVDGNRQDKVANFFIRNLLHLVSGRGVPEAQIRRFIWSAWQDLAFPVPQGSIDFEVRGLEWVRDKLTAYKRVADQYES